MGGGSDLVKRRVSGFFNPGLSRENDPQPREFGDSAGAPPRQTAGAAREGFERMAVERWYGLIR